MSSDGMAAAQFLTEGVPLETGNAIRNGDSGKAQPGISPFGSFDYLGAYMRTLAIVGVVVLVLGILSFFVPVPYNERHGVNLGDASVSVTTHHDQTLPPAVGGVLCAVGAVLLIAGMRKA
jgi:hypothetical protein